MIRLDSLSKILAPGLRLGWLTSSAAFHEHLIALTDSSTQHPHGFGQVFLAELLSEHGWGLAGFDRWVSSLREEYRRRRDFFLEEFERRIGGNGLVNARAPEAGMFVWIRVNIEKHPRYQNGINAGDGVAARARTNVAQLMQELFMCCLDSGLVIVPASVFALSGDSAWDNSAVPIEDVSIRCSGLRIGVLKLTTGLILARTFPTRDVCGHRGDYEERTRNLGQRTPNVLHRMRIEK